MVKQLRMVTAFSEISVATIENGDKKKSNFDEKEIMWIHVYSIKMLIYG